MLTISVARWIYKESTLALEQNYEYVSGSCITFIVFSTQKSTLALQEERITKKPSPEVENYDLKWQFHPSFPLNKGQGSKPIIYHFSPLSVTCSQGDCH